ADHTRAARVLRPSLRAAGFALLRAGSSRPHAELGAGQAAHLQGRAGAVAPLRTTSRTPQAGARAGAGALPDMRMSEPGGRCGRPSPVTRLRRFLELAGRAGRWTACCGLLAVGGGAFAVDVTRAPYIPDRGSIAVRCGRLIHGLADAPGPAPLRTGRCARIERVTDGGADTAGLPLLDLSRYTCLPGLIDTHTHLTDRANETRDLSVYFSRSDDDSLRISRANAEITLFAGFTSVRNVGAYVGWSARDLRDRIDAGEIAGPRMQVAGFYLTVPGGGGDLLIPGFEEDDIPYRVRMGVARGVDEFRRKAMEAVAGGADV